MVAVILMELEKAFFLHADSPLFMERLRATRLDEGLVFLLGRIHKLWHDKEAKNADIVLLVASPALDKVRQCSDLDLLLLSLKVVCEWRAEGKHG